MTENDEIHFTKDWRTVAAGVLVVEEGVLPVTDSKRTNGRKTRVMFCSRVPGRYFVNRIASTKRKPLAG